MLTLICQMSNDGATIMKWTKNFVQFGIQEHLLQKQFNDMIFVSIQLNYFFGIQHLFCKMFKYSA